MLRFFALASATFLMSAMLLAHELPDDRVTIVQREPTHVSITFYVDEVGLLHRLIAPKSSRSEFLLACASLPQAALAGRLQAARTAFESEVTVRGAHHRNLVISAFRWPTLADTQRLLKESALTLLTTGSDHERGVLTEIDADATADESVDSIIFVKPRSLPRLVTVSYRPLQQQMNDDINEIKIAF